MTSLPDTRKMANAIRALAMDAVQQANSGHPGMPMGMAEIAVALWGRHLRHNPADPKWMDRDRFVVSNGHGSMLLYALLHLSGYDLPMDELRNFRQMHSKTPGHPEVDITPGVETTTGPLGQGIANAVGMALTESLLAAHFNKPGFDIVDHYTYVFLGDGCLMEGISHEACSLAGTLGLSKLIVMYDDNGISIDGKVEGWFKDDTPKRFASYGWNVIPNVDGHDVNAVDAAITAAKKSDRPTLICCKTVIGKGAPTMQGIVESEIMPGPNIQSDDEMLDWIKKNAETTYHPVGTCKMGSDPMAVVDDRLRVHGIAGLRVADASIMPTLTSGNTNAPSIMIGEKASRMVLEDAAAA